MDGEQTLPPGLTVRGMAEKDVEQARFLMKELGYELASDEFRRRYRAVASDGKHVLQVAELDGRLVALLHAYARPAIDKPPEAVVQALVVAASQRGRGIGAAMMRSAETWARR